MGVKAYKILYHAIVIRDDMSRLDKKWREVIKTAIEMKLTTQPDLFGAPLRQSLKGYRKLRIGNYRVVYRIERDTVKVLVIDHRTDVYFKAESRILKTKRLHK